jgi:hypothetical protein
MINDNIVVFITFNINYKSNGKNTKYDVKSSRYERKFSEEIQQTSQC